MLQSDLSAEVYKNFVMNDLEDFSYLGCMLLKNIEAQEPRIAKYYN